MKTLYAVGFHEIPETANAEGIIVHPVEVPDWNRDLSPWEWKNPPRKMGTFPGGANEFLNKCAFEEGAIIGYSLAGLFSLYAALETGKFECAACLSGSLWYPGFLEYLQKKEAPQSLRAVYLSLGSGESRTSNAIFSKNEEYARETQRILIGKGVDCRLEILEGGHSVGADARICRGFEQLINCCKTCWRTEILL